MTSRSSQYVEVQLEIGHRATPKTKQTPEGHTHDWTVFVRGPENSNIQSFVEKVVFHLHESFPKHKRVIKEPPYQVSESGYAGFELPVEVYFKNKEEPKKICFDYDLYLRLDDAVSNTRREKLTFQNPSNDFKKKLLKAGGVTNESSSATTKSTTNSDDKQQTSTTNTNKYSKSNISGNETKKSKASGVIPSKDKSSNNAQSLTTSSSLIGSVPEKHPIIASTNNQFTDLFGTPIQARPASDSAIIKNKESTSKNKCTTIASKGLKNDSKSLHKNPTKSFYSSPSHKNIESKTGKESKGTNKIKESTKTKHDEEDVPAKQKKRSSLSPPHNENIDKKSSDFKGSKKRKTSTSSNASSVTYNNFGTSAETKQHKEYSPKCGSNKDHENKKESKKQKVSSKDSNSASGVKKQSLTSTKISFSNSNSSTTIEIKSVKKEKTWDNEVKKSKSKEFKSSEFKSAKENLNSNNSNASQNATKTKEDSSSLKSPKVNGNKNSKVPKDKYNSTHREVSSSPSSGMSGSLTPGGVALSSSSSINGPMASMMADMDSRESMSPLSSDTNTTSTPVRFDRSNRNINNDLNDRLVSDDSDSDESPKRNKNSNKKSHSRDSSQISKNQTESIKVQQINKRKRDSSKEINKLCDQSKNESRVVSSLSPAHETSLNFQEYDSVFLTDLIELQKRISESTNTDLLQRIVDTIEESGLFNITNSTFDFDLMKLDKNTIRKIKSFFIS